MILGCIGDDFTGSSDIANTLARKGMRAVQYVGVPAQAASREVEAGVVALKSRTIAAADAVRQSLDALSWLEDQGCRQFVFKICSTFDSTDAGNIGPVSEALAEALGAGIVPVCPAFPATGRSVYQGHLFVFDRLLSETGMRDHPLTPMHDPDLRRVLARQATGAVGHVPHAKVRAGAAAIRQALADEAAAERRLVIVDAIADDDLMALGRAAGDLPLLVGGSGVALGLPQIFAEAGLLRPKAAPWPRVDGPAVAIAGSVSEATRRQVAAHIRAGHPAREINVDAAMAGRLDAAALADWAGACTDGVPLIYATADPPTVRRHQERHGRRAVAETIEALIAGTARLLAERGFERIVTAGGETSGAVVTALGVDTLEIGPEIDPGVPALKVAGRPLALALKSGNFGAEDFFSRATAMLAGSA